MPIGDKVRRLLKRPGPRLPAAKEHADVRPDPATAGIAAAPAIDIDQVRKSLFIYLQGSYFYIAQWLPPEQSRWLTGNPVSRTVAGPFVDKASARQAVNKWIEQFTTPPLEGAQSLEGQNTAAPAGVGGVVVRPDQQKGGDDPCQQSRSPSSLPSSPGTTTSCLSSPSSPWASLSHGLRNLPMMPNIKAPPLPISYKPYLPRNEPTEVTLITGVFLRLRRIRCSKQGCGGCPHGPYHYITIRGWGRKRADISLGRNPTKQDFYRKLADRLTAKEIRQCVDRWSKWKGEFNHEKATVRDEDR